MSKLDDFAKRLRDAISRVKPLTPERVAAARATSPEQEVSGGVDREPLDEGGERCETCGAQCHVRPVLHSAPPEEARVESKSELLAALASTLRHRISKQSQYVFDDGSREPLIESELLLAAELLGAPPEIEDLAVVEGRIHSVSLTRSSDLVLVEVRVDRDSSVALKVRWEVSKKICVGDRVKIRFGSA